MSYKSKMGNGESTSEIDAILANLATLSPVEMVDVTGNLPVNYIKRARGWKEHFNDINANVFQLECTPNSNGNKITQYCKLHYEWNKDYCHEFTGDFYKCEDCLHEGSKDCMLDDKWEMRVRDGVFLCYRCYEAYQRRLDIG